MRRRSLHTYSTNLMPWKRIINRLGEQLVKIPVTNVGEWQSIREDSEMSITRELRFVSLEYRIPESAQQLALDIQPNLPWAEEHFLERVSGVAYNPPPSHVRWPFAQANNAEHTDGEKFSHTYPERMWPKHVHGAFPGLETMRGIRFDYGDLDDVIKLLQKHIHTRQAFLPIWFPEDTGVVHGERVPCTLGYHFLVREDKLNIVYYIRSCDFLRHFADDVYMTCRLAQWVAGDLPVEVGSMVMHISSLHVFEGDQLKMEKRYG